MAEALAPVPDPLLTSLRPGPWVAAADAARALARELLPEEAPVEPPMWLLPGQAASLRRVIAALRRYRGALLADPVGSGKTYIALAATAAICPGGGAACLAPATLLPQWRDTAASLGVPLDLLSHEQVSRGRLPEPRRGLVLIDEAHRFRNPRTRRYRTLAPWLVGRSTLLITATPVVNRLEDLLHQLLLAVRDDALLPDGVVSLGALLRAGAGSPALGRLVIERRPPEARPERADRLSTPDEGESEAADAALELIDRLSLSRSGSIAALVRTVLQHAAASSPAALVGALRRYRGLLLHARDARAAGRPVSRAAIRRFTGESGDQLVLWELFSPEGEADDLDLADLEQLDGILACAERHAQGPDPKAARLTRLLEDGTSTLVFVARRETVRHLRERLGERGIAWCTGERAGLGSSVLPRATVLGWFREGPGAPAGVLAGARHLIVTDVAAEGLDLQRAARVVHYDLPWTPMRLDQRDGRAVRLGSRHRSVEIVRFTLPSGLERVLRIGAALQRKRRLPAAAGIGPAGRRLWRWQTELAESLGSGHAVPGAATVPTGPAGALAGFGLYARIGGGEIRLAFALGWLGADGAWSEEEATIAARLATAARYEEPTSPDAARLRTTIELLAEPIRARMIAVRERRWAAGGCDSAARIVAARLQHAVRGAARRRDAAALVRLERAMEFVAGGHTAGETMLLERLAQADGSELAEAAGRLPRPSVRWGPVEARVLGMVLFVPP